MEGIGGEEQGGRGCNVQRAQSEHGDETVFLPFGQMQVLEDGHRKQQDDDVDRDVQRRVGEPDGSFAEAVAWLLFGPEIRHWGAVEGCVEDGSDAYTWSVYDCYVFDLMPVADAERDAGWCNSSYWCSSWNSCSIPDSKADHTRTALVK